MSNPSNTLASSFESQYQPRPTVFKSHGVLTYNVRTAMEEKRALNESERRNLLSLMFWSSIYFCDCLTIYFFTVRYNDMQTLLGPSGGQHVGYCK